MKPIKLIALICLGLSAKAQTTYPGGISGCIARWTFDIEEAGTFTTLPDVSGNNHHGTTTNIVSTNGFRNKALKAGLFNGSSSWAQVAHHTMLNPNEITIVSLVKMNRHNSDPCQCSQIISKVDAHFISGCYGQGINDNPYDLSCSIFTPEKAQLISQIGIGSHIFAPGSYVDTSKWYFFASIVSPTQLRQYQIVMDTNLLSPNIPIIDSITGSYTLGANLFNITIGKHGDPNYPYWVNGAIDELVLFNRALNASEIYKIYTHLWGTPSRINEPFIQNNRAFHIITEPNSLHIRTDETNYSIEVHNYTGQTVYKEKNFSGNVDIPLKNVNSGILLIKIIDKQNNKFIFKNLKTN